MCPVRENVAFFPGCLGAMLVHQMHPVHRVRTEPRAQALDELRQAGRAALGTCKEVAGLLVRLKQRAAPQAQREYRSRQLGACKPLAQQFDDPSRLRRGLREAKAHACRRHITVPQREVDRVHPATPEPEERAQFIHQRLGNPAKALRVGDLGL